jgi:hypothetical protein
MLSLYHFANLSRIWNKSSIFSYFLFSNRLTCVHVWNSEGIFPDLENSITEYYSQIQVYGRAYLHLRVCVWVCAWASASVRGRTCECERECASRCVGVCAYTCEYVPTHTYTSKNLGEIFADFGKRNWGILFLKLRLRGHPCTCLPVCAYIPPLTHTSRCARVIFLELVQRKIAKKVLGLFHV